MTDRELIGRLEAMAARSGSPDDEALRAAVGRLNELALASHRTLPVRIAVAMGSSGNWYSFGQNGYGDHDMCQEALGQLGDDLKVCYIIKADLAVPETQEIKGRIAKMYDEAE
jgi:hypothetical protein